MRKIDASAIGIKTPIKVNETTRNVKDTFKFQHNVIERGIPTGKNEAQKVMSYYDGQVEVINLIVDYIVDILGLNAKQSKQLENTEFPKIQKLSRQIVTKILHYDDDDKSQKKGKK